MKEFIGYKMFISTGGGICYGKYGKTGRQETGSNGAG
jgi:hypothetical protein